MIYKWINNGKKSDTYTNNPDYISRLDVFIAESELEQDEDGRYIINDEIRETILNASTSTEEESV